jgi:hypothetical protein
MSIRSRQRKRTSEVFTTSEVLFFVNPPPSRLAVESHLEAAALDDDAIRAFPGDLGRRGDNGAAVADVLPPK